MKTKTIALNVAGALICAAAFSAWATVSTQCTASQPGAPCYAQNDDILAGKWNLLPNNDLLLSYTPQTTGGAFNSQIFQTKNKTVSSATQVSDGGPLAKYVLSPEPVVVVGHFWESANRGSVAFYLSGGGASSVIDIRTRYDSATQQQPVQNYMFVGADIVGTGVIRLATAMAKDFDHDGYDEIVLIFKRENGPPTYYAQFFTATDRTAPRKGMRAIGQPYYGQPILLNMPNGGSNVGNSGPTIAMAAGDFNGDGRTELAFGQSNPGPAISIFTVTGNSASAFNIRPQRGMAPIIGMTTANNMSSDGVRTMSLAAGEFDGNTNDGDELVVAYLNDGNSGLSSGSVPEYLNVVVARINGNNWTVTALDSIQLYDSYLKYASCPPPDYYCTYYAGSLPITNVQVKTGRFNPDSVTDNAVVLISLKDLNSQVNVGHKAGPSIAYALRPQNQGTPDIPIWTYTWDTLFYNYPHTFSGGTTLSCLADIAIGRFDPPSNSMDAQGNPALDRSLQLAVAGSNSYCDNASSNIGVGIYTVNADASGQNAITVNDSSAAFITNPNPAVDPITVDPAQRLIVPIALNAQDTQGRSLQLGQPTIVRIHKREPTFIVEAPPMHADWIGGASPTPSDPVCSLSALTPPCFLNISLLPSKFFTDYSSSATTSVQIETKSTSSWSTASKKKQEDKITFEVPEVSKVAVSTQQSGSNSFEHNNAINDSNFRSSTYSVDTKTGFGDVIVFTDYWQNIYSYPVLNQKVCPGQDHCPPDATQPLVINYAAPDTVNNYRIDASTQTWYQPPHEPGNIFSYPCSQATAQSVYGGKIQGRYQSSSPWLYTDSSPSTDTFSWQTNTGTNQSVGTTVQSSWDVSTSVSMEVKTQIGPSFEHSDTVDLSSSDSFGDQVMFSSTTSATSSIAMVNPGFNVNVQNKYEYGYSSLILGAVSDAIQFKGYQTLPPYPNTQGKQTNPQITTAAPLSIRYVANAETIQAAQIFWRNDQTGYLKPDIALNHPQRLNAVDAATDEYAFNPPHPSPLPGGYPIEYGFYAMKGFFVSSQSQQTASMPAGPNLQSATDGDQLALWARVYNYSYGQMPLGTAVKVRFYAQQVNNSIGQLIPGTLQQIGNDATLPHGIDPFPNSDVNHQFCTASSQNWQMANVAFDTTGLAGSSGRDYLFWVVTWMEDSQGKVLFGEQPDHGLQTSFDPSTVYTDLTQVPVEGHSNNVGLYNASFHIYPATAASATDGSNTPPLELTNLRVEKTPVILGKQTAVSVKAVAGNEAVGPHSIYFYDRYYQENGKLKKKLFDNEHIVHIKANRSYLARTSFFQPESCGVHTLIAKIQPEQWRKESQSLDVEVVLDPVAAIKNTKTIIAKAGELSGNVKKQLRDKLNAAQNAFEQGDASLGLLLYDEYHDLLQQLYGNGVPKSFYGYLNKKYDTFRTCIVNATTESHVSQGPRVVEEES